MSEHRYTVCQECVYNKTGSCHRHAPRPWFEAPTYDVLGFAQVPKNVVWPRAQSGCGEGYQRGL